ncbi:MAG: ABC transporter ATP-binding protein [Actinomycetota bacterium]
MITAKDISFGYNGSLVLDGISVNGVQGKVVGLIGPNGSGKTTLLRVLYGALGARAGLVSLDDDPIGSLSQQQIARRVSVVVQEGAADFPITAAEMVLLGRTPHLSMMQRHRPEDYRIAAAALTKVGMRPLAHRIYAGLSGGEKQRVLIARALAQQADHLLLDEPTNHLDIRYQHEVLELVRTLEVTTVVVLHDLNLAARYCDELILLDRGRIHCSGPPGHVLTPKVIEPVYEIGVQCLKTGDGVHLVFRPNRPA